VSPGFDLWRFMSSPNTAAEASRKAKRGKGPYEKPRVPWWISITFFAGVLRVLLGTLFLLGISIGYGDPMPAWFNWLIILHGVAMIAALVVMLNGFGWGRVAWLALALLQLLLDQGMITRYYLGLDIVLLVVFVLPASNRYMAECADGRSPPVEDDSPSEKPAKQGKSGTKKAAPKKPKPKHD